MCGKKTIKKGKKVRFTCVYAGVGGRNAELGLNEFGNEGDEGCDDGTLSCVGQADEQERHVAEDSQRSLGEVWEEKKKRKKTRSLISSQRN